MGESPASSISSLYTETDTALSPPRTSSSSSSSISASLRQRSLKTNSSMGPVGMSMLSEDISDLSIDSTDSITRSKPRPIIPLLSPSRAADSTPNLVSVSSQRPVSPRMAGHFSPKIVPSPSSPKPSSPKISARRMQLLKDEDPVLLSSPIGAASLSSPHLDTNDSKSKRYGVTLDLKQSGNALMQAQIPKKEKEKEKEKERKKKRSGDRDHRKDPKSEERKEEAKEEDGKPAEKGEEKDSESLHSSKDSAIWTNAKREESSSTRRKPTAELVVGSSHVSISEPSNTNSSHERAMKETCESDDPLVKEAKKAGTVYKLSSNYAQQISSIQKETEEKEKLKQKRKKASNLNDAKLAMRIRTSASQPGRMSQILAKEETDYLKETTDTTKQQEIRKDTEEGGERKELRTDIRNRRSRQRSPTKTYSDMVTPEDAKKTRKKRVREKEKEEI